MNILFFDTETNGKPINYRAPVTDLRNWPRVIQLGYQIADSETAGVLKTVKCLVKPDGWTVPVEDFWIKHGYSTSQCEEQGLAMGVILEEFVSDIQSLQVDVMVAHNMAFDINVLGAEMIRYGKKAGRKMIQICTMIHGTDLCKLPGGRGGQFKWPRLEELYRVLFNKDFEGAHDAGADVAACRECYFEMIKREVMIVGS
ncbi:MAG: 3'-5' exonuclease [Chitinophagaceae bacterium]